jgi:hypothetical protein
MSALLLEVLILTGVVLAAWLLAVRAAPDLLQPGHGPLWYAGSAMTLLTGAAIAVLPVDSGVSRAFSGLVRRDTFNALVLGLLFLVVSFPLLRLLFSVLYRPQRHEPPVPPAFLLAGIAPDGSPLVRFRSLLRGLSAVGLLVAAGLLPWLPGPPALPAQEHTLWAFSFAALLGVLLGSTHPVRPLPDPPQPPRETPPDRLPLGERVTALHQWLGSPVEAEALPAVTHPTTGQPVVERLGLPLYPYQARVLGDWATTPVLALAGPSGSGKSTAAILRAAELALGVGAACVVLTPTAGDARRWVRQARALLGRASAGGAITLEDNPRPAACDLWAVSANDLEHFLDETHGHDEHPLLQRLQLVVVEDCDALYGPAVARMRFLLYRLTMVCPAPPQLLLTANLAPAVLSEVAQRIAAAPVQTISTSGERDAQGARSRPVRRFVVDPQHIDHKRTATNGLLGVPDGVARLVREVEGPHARLRAEVLGEPWQAWPPPEESEPQAATEALVCRIGPRSAWQVLGQRRYYAGDDAPSHEYLLFADDPMAQLLRRQFADKRTWWPQWFDTRRFPRVLSAVPGAGDTPAGLAAEARRHLRAALDASYADVDRLRQVFSTEVADQVLASLQGSALFERFEAWRPGPADTRKVAVQQWIRARGATGGQAQGQAMAVLRDASLGTEYEVPALRLEYDQFEGAIVEFGGKRYRVQRDPGQPRRRLLVEEKTAVTATPIRTIRFEAFGTMEARLPRFGGRESVEVLRGSVRLHLTHRGVHVFGYGRDGTGDSNQHGLQRLYENLLPEPVTDSRLVTRAFAICPPGADEVVLHTLTHVLRDCLDYFFLGASDFIGVSYELDLSGRPAVILYDRHPEGLGCLDDIDDNVDLQALLSAVRAILAGCDCEAHCPRCSRSTSCTQRPHNQGLDRKRTLAVLDTLLQRGK